MLHTPRVIPLGYVLYHTWWWTLSKVLTIPSCIELRLSGNNLWRYVVFWTCLTHPEIAPPFKEPVDRVIHVSSTGKGVTSWSMMEQNVFLNSAPLWLGATLGHTYSGRKPLGLPPLGYLEFQIPLFIFISSFPSAKHFYFIHSSFTWYSHFTWFITTFESHLTLREVTDAPQASWSPVIKASYSTSLREVSTKLATEPYVDKYPFVKVLTFL